MDAGTQLLHYEGITRTNMTWSAFLYTLASGALAASSLAGLQLTCPLCGDFGMRLYYRQFVEEG